MKKAVKHEMRVHVWTSIPCTAGCPWRYVNDAMGIQTGDSKMTDELIKAASKLCNYTRSKGNGLPAPCSGRTPISNAS